MSNLVDVDSLVKVAGISLVAGVGVVLLFSLGVIGLSAASAPEGATVSTRVGGKVGGYAALAACAALVVLGVIVMLNK
jgi:putative Mn2+ efflux pump MntP